MPTLKRLYLYGVLAVVGIPLLVGLADIVRLLFESLATAAGSTLPASARLDREGLSLAVAFVLVGAPVWVLHAWLVRRTTSARATDRADELASAPRAVYFLVVLAFTLIATVFAAADAIATFARAVALEERPDELAGVAATAIVFGSAWLGHVAVRRRDLRLEPVRTADDWSTRLYLYGVLFALAVMAMVTAAETLTILAHELSGLQPRFEGPDWFEEVIAGALAMAVVATGFWSLHMAMGDRLTRAPSPMGEAHRDSRSRVAYFLGVVLLCAVAVLVSLGEALRAILSGVLGVWESVDGSRFEQEAYGPWIAVVPFLVAWWYHGRRAAREALEFGGRTQESRVVRARRLLVALVGLVGVTFGVAWGIGALMDLIGEAHATGVISEAVLRADATLGLAAALVGAAMWLPAWYRLQRDRASDPVDAAASTARRAYLLLVSGVAVVAAMGSFAWLVYQFIRVAAEAGQADDWTWAIGGLAVALVVLGYHLLTLRSDLSVVAAAKPSGEVEPVSTPKEIEELEILGPPDADFEAVNDSIRSGLPKGYELRVIPRHGGQ